MPITTEAKVEVYITTDIDPSISSDISNYITAVQNWIENYTGVSFVEEAAATKYYDGSGLDTIDIDPINAITALTILDVDGTSQFSLTEGHSDDYLLYPLNGDVKNQIVLLPTGTIRRFPKRPRSVQVEADFGYSSVPEDVEVVASKLVAKLIDRGLRGGKLESVELGDYKATYKEIDEEAEPLGIYNILDQYREYTL